MTEDEMVGWHHQLDGHELEQAMGVGDGQGSLVCCSPWVTKSWTWLRTELNWTPWSKWGQSRCSVQAGSYVGLVTGDRLESWVVSICFLPLVPESKQACAHSSQVECRFLTVLLFHPTGFQTSSRVLSSLWWTPRLRCLICDVGWTSHSPGRISESVHPTSSSVSSPRGTGPNLITPLLFLVDSVWLILTALVVKESSWQSPVCF